jgi:hypothetical protein
MSCNRLSPLQSLFFDEEDKENPSTSKRGSDRLPLVSPGAKPPTLALAASDDDDDDDNNSHHALASTLQTSAANSSIDVNQ